ncbi:MAG: class I SAM-dependent methyltransferase [Candidatus Hydrogenedentes bacterium]|nr:class I SAM-dependent methyltransferase [Candidatus Hydrogenedentota bacterium]
MIFGTGFDCAPVLSERAYSEATFHGDPRLTDPNVIAGYPDALTEIWPDTWPFAPDFRQLLGMLAFGHCSHTLDVGTGSCWTTRMLAEQGGHVVAMDVVETPFNGLRAGDIQMHAHRVYFDRVLESMTNMPFKDDSFDHVVFNASFHHSPDEGKTLAEVYRVLKRDGVAALLSEIAAPIAPLRKRIAGHDRAGAEEGSSHHDVPYRKFSRLARKLGFHMRLFLPEHLRIALRKRLPLGGLPAGVLGHSQSLLRLVCTSFILLRK